MLTLVRAVLLLALTAILAAGSDQFVTRYVPVGTSGSAKLLAVDSSGNFFIVAVVEEPSGRPQIRAIKTDPQGNVLASFDFGGSLQSYPDSPSGVAIDPQGDLVIVGTTDSADFPLVTPLVSKPALPAGFVVKLDSELTEIVYSTLLGGTQASNFVETRANAVAVDAAGDTYVTGSTSASDFPTTPGAFQTAGPMETGFGSPSYAFVTEIAPDGGSLVYSTFFGSPNATCVGGSTCLGVFGSTSASAIALDNTGAVVIGGATTANQLPVTPGTLGQQCGCGNTLPNYIEAGFLAKFAPGGGKLDWATYLPFAQTGPGEYLISITNIALDADGNVVFGGGAAAGWFVSTGALQSSASTGQYGAPFVAKVNASAASYIFSTYFGDGIFDAPAGALALDSQGDIWLTGGSDPTALPLPGSTPLLGTSYIAGLSPDGSSVLSAITAPGGAAGQAIVFTPSGTPAALGSAGSLLLDLPAQPASLVGVANSAGIQVSSQVAPYELVSFYGAAIGPANAMGAQIVNGAVTNSLGGVQVLFNGVAAPLLYAGPNQINAIVPSSVVEQDTATVQIMTPAGPLAGPLLAVVPSEPEVFQNSAPAPPGGAAIALNQDGSVNSANNPAAAGTVVTVWATGTGLDNGPGDQDGLIATAADSVLLPVSVFDSSNVNVFGVYSLEVLYAGNAPGMVTGVVQVNFRLPENLFDVGQLTCQLQIGSGVSSRFFVYVTQ
jgi:uncharacterized protein (TIGR03437 family)